MNEEKGQGLPLLLGYHFEEARAHVIGSIFKGTSVFRFSKNQELHK